MQFPKAHVQYLGHLISGQGIEPVAEKLESVRDMPPYKCKGGKAIP